MDIEEDKEKPVDEPTDKIELEGEQPPPETQEPPKEPIKEEPKPPQDNTTLFQDLDKILLRPSPFVPDFKHGQVVKFFLMSIML